MSEPMGLREFGRWIGLSGEAVRKAIKTGRIPDNLIGEKALRTGRLRPTIIDPEAARKAMGANTDESMQRDNEKIGRNRKAVAHGKPPPDDDADDSDEGATIDDIERLIESGKAPSITQSRQVAEAYKARRVKMEYEKEIGLLVDARAIKEQIAGMITTARTRLLGVPSKAKGRIPHLTPDEIAILDELQREALEDCVDAR